jgi:hypothetical protein
VLRSHYYYFNDEPTLQNLLEIQKGAKPFGILAILPTSKNSASLLSEVLGLDLGTTLTELYILLNLQMAH